jgi:hypothetical protein
MSNWYRGDCHVHSVHSSGGELTPEQLAVAARAVGLDFIAGTGTTRPRRTSSGVGRSWIAESAAVRLDFSASAADRHAGTGEQLKTGGHPAVACVEVHDVASGVVTFHTQNGAAHSISLPAMGSGTAQWQTSAAESAFVRIEVRHPGGQMAALTNPITLL